MTTLIGKDIRDHYLDMMELDEDPYICGERFIRTFAVGIHHRIAAMAVLDEIADNGRQNYGKA